MPSITVDNLGAYLGDELSADVTIANLAPVTAGARRINVLFDSTIDGSDRGLCITQLPNEGDAFRSIPDEVQWLNLAHDAGMNVAEVVAWSDDASILGGPFFYHPTGSRRHDPQTCRRLVRFNARVGRHSRVSDRRVTRKAARPRHKRSARRR